MAGIATLSGWGQPHDALSAIATQALHIDYAQYATVADALAHITGEAKGSEVVIGWSLGGQLAVRAVAAGLIRPKYLVLVATPFQFVATPDFPFGMPRDTYEKFRDNYARNPERTLAKAWELVIKDDSQADKIRDHMELQDKRAVLQKDWLNWLRLMDGFSARDFNFSSFPPTLLIHGVNDVVVDYKQSQHFADKLSERELVTCEACGHAPHWRYTDRIKQTISEYAHV